MPVYLKGPNWVLYLKLASPRCSYWKYVDDITISEFAAARGVSILQSELDNISTWAATNNMVLNSKKCKEMTLRFRRVVDHLPSALTTDTKALESADAHKVLGVTIQSNLKWDLHINEVLAKALPRGLSYYWVCTTSHKKDGVV